MLFYGKGMASGIIANETVGFSDDCKVVEQNFLLVDKDKDFDGMEADGLLGLGFKTLSNGRLTFVETLKEQGVIDKAIFAIYLSDNNYGRSYFSNPKSSISIGEYDLETYAKDTSESSVNYFKVYNETGYWSVNCSSISIGSTLIHSQAQLAMLDTGTSLILGPPDQVTAIHSYFTKHFTCEADSGDLVCRCATSSEFPDITFSFEEKPLKVPPSKYFYEVRLSQYNNYCKMMIKGTSTDMWILGDVFLRNYYVIYDMDKPQVGITEASGHSGSTVTIYVVIAVAILVVVLLLLSYSLAIVLKRRCNRSPTTGLEPSDQPMQPNLTAPFLNQGNAAASINHDNTVRSTELSRIS